MNILVDIGHPAHVHLMKYAIKELQAHGHTVTVTTKDIPIVRHLLDHYGIQYIVLGHKGKSLHSKMLRQILFDLKLWRIAVANHIDVATGTSMTIPIVSRFCRMKSVNMDDDDDDVQPLSVKYSHPFSNARLTPAALKEHRRSKHAVFYNGTHELAYLHPNRFAPDPAALQHANITTGERFFILRLVAFNAYHDTGENGISPENQRRLIELLKPHGRILITSEKPLTSEFEPYRLPVPPEEIHSLMAYSSLFLGDSQTMTSEAAVLGVPALKCNTFAGRLSVPNMLEQRYGLCYAYLPSQFDEMYHHIEQLLARNPDELKKEWQAKRKRMLNEMIDPTEFFVNFIEHYESLS
ncbi:MAG: DUF354 domain-containing protein [Bacteroidales bacterium]|nr:DUF354 domain-containing protein [Bacteroidales bacterium]